MKAGATESVQTLNFQVVTSNFVLISHKNTKMHVGPKYSME